MQLTDIISKADAAYQSIRPGLETASSYAHNYLSTLEHQIEPVVNMAKTYSAQLSSIYMHYSSAGASAPGGDDTSSSALLCAGIFVGVITLSIIYGKVIRPWLETLGYNDSIKNLMKRKDI